MTSRSAQWKHIFKLSYNEQWKNFYQFCLIGMWRKILLIHTKTSRTILKDDTDTALNQSSCNLAIWGHWKEHQGLLSPPAGPFSLHSMTLNELLTKIEHTYQFETNIFEKLLVVSCYTSLKNFRAMHLSYIFILIYMFFARTFPLLRHSDWRKNDQGSVSHINLKPQKLLKDHSVNIYMCENVSIYSHWSTEY